MDLTYFIVDAHGYVKIGKTTDGNLRKRFIQLQISHAEPLVLLAVTTEPEATCHARFSSLRVRGEWFRVEPSLLDWLSVHGDFEPLESYPAVDYKDRRALIDNKVAQFLADE